MMTHRYEQSVRNFEKARKYILGGVNSPVRAFHSVGMEPITVERGKGSKVVDVDGHEYIDYINSYGPLILGHAHPAVVDALQEATAKGTSFGTPTEMETALAERVVERMPSVDVVRMVNSGTEATMSALRLARGYTERDLILKFEGCYHGHSDSLLIKAGSGVATLGLPDSPGVPASLAEHTLTVPYNDLESVREVFATYGDQIAGVILEPVAGNMGVVPPKPGFLQGLREVTQKYGSLLIFDEVMTGFRVHPHSGQGLYEVTPDLTTMGKVIGGGLPVGAFGGKKEIMERMAPVGPVYQAGTLSGNPLAMTAGYTTLKEMGKDGAYEELEQKATRLEAGMEKAAVEKGVPHHINRVGSMMSFFFTDREVSDYESVQTADTDRYATYFRTMLEQGISLAPAQFEAIFVSTAHTDEDIDRTLEAHERALDRL